MSLGKAFSLGIVAEGVENNEQFELLKNMNCDEFQGYYYSGNDSNLLIVFYVQIMPDDLVIQLHRF